MTLFLVGFYECSDILGCQVLSTITRKTQATSFTKDTALNKAWLVRCCLQNRVTNDSTKQVSFDEQKVEYCIVGK